MAGLANCAEICTQIPASGVAGFESPAVTPSGPAGTAARGAPRRDAAAGNRPPAGSVRLTLRETGRRGRVLNHFACGFK